MSVLALDIETVGDQLVCVGWVVDDGPTQSSPTLPDEVRSLLADTDTTLVTHTGFDERFLRRQLGCEVKATRHDTQVMAWLVNENTPLDLAYLSKRYLGREMDKNPRKHIETLPWDELSSYCETDVSRTRELHTLMAGRLAAEGLWDYFDVVEAPFTAVLRDMECEGLPVDLDATKVLEQMYLSSSTTLQASLTEDLPSCFNIRSPKQVALLLGSVRFTLPDKLPRSEERELDEVLDELAGVETNPETVEPGSFITTKRGRLYDHGYWVCAGFGVGYGGFNTPLPSVARGELLSSRIAVSPWVTDYLTFKKYDKLIGTYLQVFQERAEGGRVYARFNQTGTVTGRLSSAGPNLQNIPSRGSTGESVRRLITGNLVVGDFSQLEPRLMAHFSQDPKMLAVFNEGRDIYEDIATSVGCTRDVAKVLVLAMGYGAGAEKVAGILTINGYPTRMGEAQRLLKKLREEYIVYFAWRESTILSSKTAGYVETLDGRKRRLTGTRDTGHAFWKDPSAPGRQAANAVVQGSAADVVRRVMLHTDKLFPNLRLLAQVHDELVWEYEPPLPPGELDRLERWVTRVAQRGVSVPLLFKPHVGPNWYDAKSGEWVPDTPDEEEP